VHGSIMQIGPAETVTPYEWTAVKQTNKGKLRDKPTKGLDTGEPGHQFTEGQPPSSKWWGVPALSSFSKRYDLGRVARRRHPEMQARRHFLSGP
jgi:hypothetical protein